MTDIEPKKRVDPNRHLRRITYDLKAEHLDILDKMAKAAGAHSRSIYAKRALLNHILYVSNEKITDIDRTTATDDSLAAKTLTAFERDTAQRRIEVEALAINSELLRGLADRLYEHQRNQIRDIGSIGDILQRLVSIASKNHRDATDHQNVFATSVASTLVLMLREHLSVRSVTFQTIGPHFVAANALPVQHTREAVAMLDDTYLTEESTLNEGVKILEQLIKLFNDRRDDRLY